MRAPSIAWAATLLCLVSGGVAQAGITGKSTEVIFSASYEDFEDDDDSLEVLTVDAAALFILAGGYFELGPVLSYLDVNEDSASSNAIAVGPRLDLNLIPQLQTTPFLTLTYLLLGGDLGDSYDDERTIGGGLKMLVGDAAAGVITLGRRTLSGGPGGDLDTTFLTAGFSIFVR